MSAALPPGWDLRRMPWLDLTDEDGHTVRLSVLASRPPHGPARIYVGDGDGEMLDLAGIGDAERVLSLIEALARRTWRTAYVGKDG